MIFLIFYVKKGFFFNFISSTLLKTVHFREVIMKKKVLTFASLALLALAIVINFGLNFAQADPDCDMCCLKCSGGCVCDSEEPDGCKCE